MVMIGETATNGPEELTVSTVPRVAANGAGIRPNGMAAMMTGMKETGAVTGAVTDPFCCSIDGDGVLVNQPEDWPQTEDETRMSDIAGTKLKYHKVAAIFPMLEGEAFEALKQDIKANGQHDPIWTYQGKIIDGRNRERACRELGIEPRIQEWDARGDLVAFVISQNLHRRHLTEPQRAIVAARLKQRLAEAARKRLATSTGGASPRPVAKLPEAEMGRARDQAAALVSVSPRSVQSACKVLDRGIPELARAVERGEVSISAAATVADLGVKEQSRLMAAGPVAVRQKAALLHHARKTAGEDGLSPSDRKWLKSQPLWDALGDNRAGFIREAHFWKHAQPLLDRIRRAFPGLEEESPERVEPYIIQLVSCVFCVHHPCRWKLCFSCEGTGVSNDPRYPRCIHCRGDGFTITMRKWGEPPSTLVG
jgi:hypothetical protein